MTASRFAYYGRLSTSDKQDPALSFPRTAARLECRGLRVERVPASEVGKAEGAVTCCSLIVRSQ